MTLMNYFNSKPEKPNKNGTMVGMSSRNNNFSNRGQKIKITVLASNSSELTSDFQNINSVVKNDDTKNNETQTILLGVFIPILFIVIGFIVYRNRIKINNYFKKKKQDTINNTSVRI